MRNIAYSLLMLLVLVPSISHATIYYKNNGGAITKIDEATFKDCGVKVIYRTSGKDGLIPEFKKKLLTASLRGDTINDAAAASTALKATEGMCSYSETDDLK